MGADGISSCIMKTFAQELTAKSIRLTFCSIALEEIHYHYFDSGVHRCTVGIKLPLLHLVTI